MNCYLHYLHLEVKNCYLHYLHLELTNCYLYSLPFVLNDVINMVIGELWGKLIAICYNNCSALGNCRPDHA